MATTFFHDLLTLHHRNTLRRQGNRQLRYLTQSVILEESASPLLIRSTMTTISVILFAFIVWAAFIRVDEISPSAGEVVPNGYIQEVQHLEGGAVAAILVREGDLVERDQPLIRLQSAKATTELEQMKVRDAGLALQVSRLKAFLDNGAALPASDATQTDMAKQSQDILQGMRAAREQQRQVLLNQLAQRKQELTGLASAEKPLRDNIALMSRENSVRQDLAEKGYSPRLSALDSQQKLNSMRGQLQETISQEQKAKAAIDEAQNRLKSLDTDLRSDALKQLGQAESERAELAQVISKLEQTVEHLEIRSPTRGLVKDIAVNTIGAVVMPGQTVMQIVPVENELMVEAQISPRDVGRIRTGQPVKVKVASYDYSRYGSVDGTLTQISPSSFTAKSGQVYYKGKVELVRNYVGNTPTSNLILPGMTVQADIITGQKTLLQYLLKPIYVAAHSAFHEQ